MSQFGFLLSIQLINRSLHDQAGIPSSNADLITHCSFEIPSALEDKILFPRGHVISSVADLVIRNPSGFMIRVLDLVFLCPFQIT